MQQVPFVFARKFGVCILPHGDDAAPLVIYKSDTPARSLTEIRRAMMRPLTFRKVDNEEFEDLLGRTFQKDSAETMEMVEGLGDDMDLASLADSVPETEDLLEQEEDAPIIKLINALLTEAVNQNASDVHVETFERDLVVRFRVDGVLRVVVKPKRVLAPLLVSRIKVMAKLDIAEKRVPQDGRIPLRVAGREVDIRVSTMPSSNGERVVMRLLDKHAGRLDLQALGMESRDLTVMQELVHKAHGVILVTGPTGSGKTTTLYAGLAELDNRSLNILTVEDPVEYNLDGIGQTQINTRADMTFARGLRAILRQDPDVVMVGEIRDLETADIAVQASLTGHLVLSTLHTNSAVGAITRLHDQGIEPFLLSSSLVGLVAQRLVRLLCPHCSRAAPATPAECEFLRADPNDPPAIRHPAGCIECAGEGYRGRTGIYEVVAVDESMRTLIHNQASEQDLERHARALGPGIRDDGRSKVLRGLTTVEEVLRVTRED